MQLGHSKHMKRIALGATGAVGCAAIAVTAVMLSSGTTTLETLASSTVPAATSSAPANNPFSTWAPSADQTTGGTGAGETGAQAGSGTSTVTPPVAPSSSTTPTTQPGSISPGTDPQATPPTTPATTTPTVAPPQTTTTTTPTTTPSVALAARTQPSAAAVDQALEGLKSYVHTPLTPTASEVATLGDEVCTAFDQGGTDAEVQAALTEKLGDLPFTTILPGAANYVVNTAVALYCPGYQSELS